MSQTKAQLIDNLVSPITGALGSASAPTFSFTADPNTGLYSPGADQVAISTNSSQRLLVDASGNVTAATGNISTTTGRFIVNTTGSSVDTTNICLGALAGSAYINTRSGYVGYLAVAGTGAYLWSSTLHTWSISGSEKLRLDSSGRLGIGTSSPGANLTLKTSAGYSFQVENASQPVFQVYNDTTASTGGAQVIVRDVDGNTAILLDGRDNANSYFNTGGRLGIGTSAPNSPFEVGIAGINLDGAIAALPAAGADSAAFIARTASTGSAPFDQAGSIIYRPRVSSTAGRSSHIFYTGSPSTIRMVIDETGKVGIGTTSPQSFVTINGGTGAGFTDVLQLSAGAAAANSGPGLSFNINYGDYDYFKTWQTGLIRSAAENTSTYNGYLAFYTNSGANATNISEKVRIDSSGRVGIGTTNPTDPNGFGNCIDIRSPTGAAIYLRDSDDTVNDAFIIGRDNSDSYLISASGNMLFLNNGSERARIDSSGRLLVGTSSSRGGWSNFVAGIDQKVQIEGTDYLGGLSIVRNENNLGGPSIWFGKTRSATVGGVGAVASGDNLGIITFQGADGSKLIEAAKIEAYVDGTPGANDMPGRLVFSTTADGAASPAERMRISSNGGISASLNNDTSTSNALLTLTRGYGVHPGKTSNYYGIYATIASSGGNFDNTAAIFGEANNDYCPGVTGKGGTTVGIGCGVQGWAIGNTDGYGVNYGLYSRLQQIGSGGNGALIGVGIELPNYAGTASTKSMGIWYRSAYTGSDTQTVLLVQRNNTSIGSITTTVSATAYNTSSDYRLKENVTLLTGATDRLKQIPVHRFNFISDPDKTVDGFLAHEAQAVVPECVTGTKDEVDADGNPVYQGIDQSKLVPLLTAALQEAIAKIETLEGMVAVNNITVDEQQHQLSTLAARLTALESA